MEPAYRPELWHDLFEMIGASAGALVGLLFIVITLHFDKVTERTDYNMRATKLVRSVLPAWMLMFGVMQAQAK